MHYICGKSLLLYCAPFPTIMSEYVVRAYQKRLPTRSCASQSRISCDTQQSLTAGFSYVSSCLWPRRMRCSTVLTLLGDTDDAWVLKL